MIGGVGTDIIEVSRIKRASECRKNFIARILTHDEIALCNSSGSIFQRVAGRFAAKEAVAKAIGTSLAWHDVEILADENGKPIVKLSGKAAVLANGMRIIVSISHCKEYAVAQALAVIDRKQ